MKDDSKKVILLVDDSDTSLMMEKMILNGGPYELVTARSGEEALERAKEVRPDLILLDVVMPGMDGFEACRRLREDEATKTTPIIMVTTKGEDKHVESGYESGCSDYVTKPVGSTELLDKVRTLLAS